MSQLYSLCRNRHGPPDLVPKSFNPSVFQRRGAASIVSVKLAPLSRIAPRIKSQMTWP